MINDPSTLLAAAGMLGAMSPQPVGDTPFSRLSPEAQGLIVQATLGAFEESGPTDMSDEVREEITAWAMECEDVQETTGDNQ